MATMKTADWQALARAQDPTIDVGDHPTHHSAIVMASITRGRGMAPQGARFAATITGARPHVLTFRLNARGQAHDVHRTDA